MDRLSPALIASVATAAVAVLLAVPWVAVEYRRRGAIATRRALYIAATLLSALGIGAYTLFPLPLPVELTCSTTPHPQLTPLAVLGSAARNGEELAQAVFNVALFVPFGALVGAQAAQQRRGVIVAVTSGVAASLLVETTQLTGVWGIYPCAFRIFDVDDLLLNTLGAAVGGLVAPTIRRWLVTVDNERAQLDAVSSGRRLLAASCDAAVMVIGMWLVATAVAALVAATGSDPLASWVRHGGRMALATPALVELVVVIVHGRTIGEWCVRLRPITFPILRQRVLRWLCGVGGWGLLLVPQTTPTNIAALAIAAAALAGAVSSRRHGGVAATLVGLTLVDDRATAVRLRRSSQHRPVQSVIAAIIGLAIVSLTIMQIEARWDARVPGNVYEPPPRYAAAFGTALYWVPGTPLGGDMLNTERATRLLHGDVRVLVELIRPTF